MTDYTNSFESGQASGTAVSTTNSGSAAGTPFTSVNGTVVYDDTHALSGTLAAKIDMSLATTNDCRYVAAGPQTSADSYVRFYVYFTANPSTATNILITATVGNAQSQRVRINTNGTVGVVNGAGSVAQYAVTTTAIALNQWVRVEAKLTEDGTNPVSCVLRLYNTPDSATADEEVTATAGAGTSAGAKIGQWRWGGNSSGTHSDTYWVDSIASSETDYIGAYVPPAQANFPTDPTDLTIEMQINSTWIDLVDGDYVLDRGISITRGRADEAGQIEPQKLSMTLDNTGGRFSPRNPASPYYGVLGRNTPVRAYVTRGETYTTMEEADEITAPDASGLGITGDIDLRVDLTTSYWAQRFIASKYELTGDQRSWVFVVSPEGFPTFLWTTAGTSASADACIATAPISLAPGRQALRVTLDVSATTATFYTSDTIDGTWTQLGDAVVSLLGTGTSIYDSTASIELGNVADDPSIISVDYDGFVGRFNAFELRDGIAGTVVANPSFTALTSGTTSIIDGYANTFTFQGNTEVTDKRWRFHGEMSSLPPRWDTSGNDRYVATDVNGIFRRLRAANTPLRSSFYRQLITKNSVAGYWPCEDQTNATYFAPATTITHPGLFASGGMSPGASSVFVGSDALPTTNGEAAAFTVPNYDNTDGSVVFFLLSISSDSLPSNGTVLASVYTSGAAHRFDFVYYTADGGGIGVGVSSSSNETAGTYDLNDPTGVINTNLNDQVLLCSVGATQDGTTMDWDWTADAFGTGWEAFAYTVYGTPFRTISSSSFGHATKITIDPGGSTSGVTFGHIGVWAGVPATATATALYNGYQSEDGGTRMARLCAEESVPIRFIGSPTSMPPMGPQGIGSLSDLLQECADADDGMLFECRDAMSLCYRTRGSLYSQDAHLTLDYDAGAIWGALEPTDDDQQVRNDITVTRDGGASAQAELTTGPLSTSAPPNGVGRYQDSRTINIWQDSLLTDYASWFVHLGTVDEARYPAIGINYAGELIDGSATLNEDGLMLEIGDRLVLTNPPDSLPPDDITQLLQGYAEGYGNYEHDQVFNCTPESPYHVAMLYSSRIDTAGSELDADATSGATSIDVATTSGEVWTTDSGNMPFDIMVGGERMTVTAITSATSPQTFTVTRSVNGIVKAQTSGTAVNIVDQAYIAL